MIEVILDSNERTMGFSELSSTDNMKCEADSIEDSFCVDRSTFFDPLFFMEMRFIFI